MEKQSRFLQSFQASSLFSFTSTCAGQVWQETKRTAPCAATGTCTHKHVHRHTILTDTFYCLQIKVSLETVKSRHIKYNPHSLHWQNSAKVKTNLSFHSGHFFHHLFARRQPQKLLAAASTHACISGGALHLLSLAGGGQGLWTQVLLLCFCLSFSTGTFW